MTRARKANDKYYWMMVTADEYEIPLVVADTVGELAEICGAKPKSIIEQISRAKRTGHKCIWAKVPREDFEEDVEE